MEDEYVGDEEFFRCLSALRDMVVSGKFSVDIKQEIYETLKCYVDGKHRLDPETVSCLFTGFIVRNLMTKKQEPAEPDLD